MGIDGRMLWYMGADVDGSWYRETKVRASWHMGVDARSRYGGGQKGRTSWYIGESVVLVHKQLAGYMGVDVGSCHRRMALWVQMPDPSTWG